MKTKTLLENEQFEGARSHELGDEHDGLLGLVGGAGDLLPAVVEAHDIHVLQRLQQLGLLAEALSFCFGEGALLGKSICTTGICDKSDVAPAARTRRR